MTGLTFQSFAAVLLVLALVATLAWVARRSSLGAVGRRGRTIQVETAVPLGERRSLVIVAVEGRRLLLGLAPGQVAMVTELERRSEGAVGGETFEQQLDARSSPPHSS